MRARTLDSEQPSGNIDGRVRESLQRSESLYTLDVPLLTRLQPDLLLTQDLCRVCSVTEDEVAVACAEAGVRPKVVSLSPQSLDEVWQSVETIAGALGCPGRGQELADTLRGRAIRRPGGSPRVAVLEWIDPPILSGLWTPELIERAGGAPWASAPGEPAVRSSWEALEQDPPDLAIVCPCSFSVDRTLRELRSSPVGLRLAGWGLPRGVWVADEAFFSRPGPRLAQGLEVVEELLRDRPGTWDGRLVRWGPDSVGGAS
jgi:iron complex transport system substrate-binding protein